MENLNDIIEFVPTSPIVLPEWPGESLGINNPCGFHVYSTEEWKDVSAVKKHWYSKAEYFSMCWMHEGADRYLSNPSVDYDIKKIIFAGKEHSAKFITETTDAWYNDTSHHLTKTNQPTDIDPKFLKDLIKKSIRMFVYRVLSKKFS